MFVRPSPYRGG